MKYNQLIIYYFSGTGNAKNAATWIINYAEKKGIDTHLINIDRFDKIEVPAIKGKALVGFCSPTHGFNLPLIMLKFIRKFPRLKNADVFILNTRGGLKLSKLFLPGLSGAAQLLPALILLVKGFNVVGMQPLDLPSNWLLLHPGLKKEVVNSIFVRCKKITERFACNLLNGKRKYKALLSLPFDLAVVPVTLAYYFIGRFFLAKSLIASSACNQCDICVLKCPVQAIKVIDNRPFWTYRCESCMRCVNFCPQRAIETTHTFSISLLIISSVVISPLLMFGLELIGLTDFVLQSFVSRKIWFMIDQLIFLLFVFMSYRLLHLLMKNKVIGLLVTYSSLSKYKFWRRYRAPNTY